MKHKQKCNWAAYTCVTSNVARPVLFRNSSRTQRIGSQHFGLEVNFENHKDTLHVGRCPLNWKFHCVVSLEEQTTFVNMSFGDLGAWKAALILSIFQPLFWTFWIPLFALTAFLAMYVVSQEALRFLSFRFFGQNGKRRWVR